MESKKMIQMTLFTEQKETYRLRGWTYGYQVKWLEKGRVRDLGIDMYILLYLN